MERTSSQMSGGRDQIMQDDPTGTSALVRQPAAAATTVQAAGPKKMTKDQEAEFKEFLVQFKTDSSPLMHILSLNSYFFNKFTEE